MRSRSDWRYAASSLRPSLLAANERFGMTLEIICEHADRSGGTAYLLQSVAELLDLRGIRLGQVAGVVECTLRTYQRAARTYECEVKIADRLAHVLTDLLQGHLVNLLDDVLDASLGRFELARSGWQLHWRLRPVDRRGRRARKEIERHECRPCQQVTR